MIFRESRRLIYISLILFLLVLLIYPSAGAQYSDDLHTGGTMEDSLTEPEQEALNADANEPEEAGSLTWIAAGRGEGSGVVLLSEEIIRLQTHPISHIYTYDDMLRDIDSLTVDYPEITEVFSIGSSVEGVPLHMIKLGTGSRKILVVGSQHAREWINTPLLMEMIKTYAADYYGEKYIGGQSIRHILNTHTICIVPLANPDGVKLQQFGAGAFPVRRQSLINMNNGSTNFTRWKSNIRGVDLNRNWNIVWSRTTGSSVPGPELYKGTAPESEPEVKAIADWIRSNDPLMHLDFHSSGEYLFWYYGQTGSNLERDQRIVNAIRSYSGYRIESVDVVKTPSSNFTRWGSMTRNVPSICVENGVYTTAYQDMRKFNYIIGKIRYLISVAIINMVDYPVFVSVDSVNLDRSELTMAVGESIMLAAVVSPPDASNKSVSWSSSDTRVATVNDEGLVTIRGTGECIITVVTEDGGNEATCRVIVPYVPVESVNILNKEISIELTGVNSRGRILIEILPVNASDKNVEFDTDGTGVVSIESNGIVYAVGEGIENVTVRTNDVNKTDRCTVVVEHNDIMYGDVNGDGEININDAILVLRYIVGLTEFSEEKILRADTSKEGVVNITDAVRILRYIVGLV